MFEWVCPKCDRTVLPELKECPHCAEVDAAARAATAQAQASAARPARSRKAFEWADFERGFRFGLGFLAVLAIGYFLLFGIAYVWNHPDWLDRLTSWMRPH